MKTPEITKQPVTRQNLIQMAVEKGIHRHLKRLAFMNDYDSLKSFHTAVINAGLRAMKLPEYPIQLRDRVA